MGNQPIRVALVDDHTMVRRGMKVLLDEYEDIQVVGEASNGLKAIELVDQLKPDVVLIDLAMPVMDGIEAIKRTIAIHPEERIIVLTSFAGDDKLFEAIRLPECLTKASQEEKQKVICPGSTDQSTIQKVCHEGVATILERLFGREFNSISAMCVAF